MRTVAFIPSRLNSQRVPNKNIKPLGGVPLINYILTSANMVKEFDDIILFSSDSDVFKYIKKSLKFTFLKRPAYLDSQNAKVQDLIREFLKLDKADLIAMLHITSPFLRPGTISECIGKVKSGEHDSAFTALEVKKNCWLNNKPINNISGNYIKSVLVEHSLYVFKRKVFHRNERRISAKPYIRIVNEIEGHDIDTSEDFRIAELIVNTGLYGLR